MYCLFGTKWSKLQCGPLNSYEPTEQGGREGSERFDPLKVGVESLISECINRRCAYILL